MGQHEIARRLVDGVWTTIDVLEDGGGPGGDWGGSSSAQFSGSGSPVGSVTPSAEGDLYVDTTTPALWQATGLTNADWQQVGQGGSLPDDPQRYDVLGVVGVPESDSPTWAEVVAERPALLAEGWQADHDYMNDLGGPTDSIQLLVPDGSPNVFAREVYYGAPTGTIEPDWSSAPNPGDSVAEDNASGSWYNVGPASSLGAAASSWSAEHDFGLSAAFVHPTAPNGHLYVLYPGYGHVSGDTEPTFLTDGGYASEEGGDGTLYWGDLGTGALTDEVVWEGKAVTLRGYGSENPDNQPPAVLTLRTQAMPNGRQPIVELVDDGLNPKRAALSVNIGPFGEPGTLELFGAGADQNDFVLARLYQGARTIWYGPINFNEKWAVDNKGREIFFGDAAAPTDEEVENGHRLHWFDGTNQRMMFKQKDNGGAPTTGKAAGLTTDGSSFLGVDKPSITVGDAAEILAALVTLGLVTDDT